MSAGTPQSAEDRFLAYARSGETGILEALLREHADQAYAQARRLLGRADLAEDAVQDAYVRLLASASQYRSDVPFAAWLGRLVYNAAIDQRRRHHSYQRLITKAATMAPSSEDGEPEDPQLEPLRAALAGLPESYRAPLSLYYFAGLDRDSIARALGLRPGTVAVRVSRGVERLRARLGRAGFAGSGAALVDLLSDLPAYSAPASLHVVSHLAAKAAAGSLTVGAAGTAAWLKLAGIAAGIAAAIVAGIAVRSDAPTAGERLPATTTSPATLRTPPLVSGTWQMVKTNGVPVQAMGMQRLVYAPALKRAVMLGNYHEESAPPGSALLAYDFAANRWDVLNLGDFLHGDDMPEAGTSGGMLADDPKRAQLIYFGGFSGTDQAENIFHTWWIDPLAQVARDKQTATRPWPGWALSESVAAFDPADDVYVFFASADSSIWHYAPSANTWTRKAAQGRLPPPGLNLAMMAYRDHDHGIYLFGGRTGYGSGSAYANDVYRYDVAANAWTLLAPIGERPAGRQKAGFAYDANHDRFLLYGGLNDSGVGDVAPLGDTWILDPDAVAWRRLSPTRSPPPAGPCDRMAYDSDHDVFVLALNGSGGYVDGEWPSYPVQTWLFRPDGSGPDPGYSSAAPARSRAGLNRDPDGWAKDAVVANGADGAWYAAWVETGGAFADPERAWFHVQIDRWRAGVRTVLGDPSTAPVGAAGEGHSPSLCVSGGIPWVAWHQMDRADSALGIQARQWDGTSWIGGPIGRVGTATGRINQGSPHLADVAGTPHIAFLQVDKSRSPQPIAVHVSAWNGADWEAKGAPLNRDGGTVAAGGCSVAGSLALASDGARPLVAWTEATADIDGITKTPPQVYVSRWDGSGWNAVGGSLNRDPADWADGAAIASHGGRHHVAWTERTVAGNSRLQVKLFAGDAWLPLAPDSLNRSRANGWAFHPSLVIDPATDDLYVGWVEQADLGQRPQVYVSRFSAGSWSALGDSLNADPTLGSAQRVELAMIDGRPAALWSEVSLGSMRQLIGKRWDGSRWIPIR